MLVKGHKIEWCRMSQCWRPCAAIWSEVYTPQKRKGKGGEGMDLSFSLVVVIIPWHLCRSSHGMVHLKYTQFSFISYASKKKKKTGKKINKNTPAKKEGKTERSKSLMSGELVCKWWESSQPLTTPRHGCYPHIPHARAIPSFLLLRTRHGSLTWVFSFSPPHAISQWVLPHLPSEVPKFAPHHCPRLGCITA